jgi:hypothetical protein
MDFKKISIKALSKQALSKLKRGLPARIMKGEGMQLVVMPHQFDAVGKAFLKNKGMNVTLSAPEVDANTVAEIGGEGIFGKRADKAMKKAGVKKLIYKTGAALKPLAMEAIDAAGAAAAAYGVPPSVIALATKETKGYIDRPEDYQTKKGQNALLKRTGKVAMEVGSPYLAEAGIDVQQVKDAAKLAREIKKASKSGGPAVSSASLKADTEDAFLSTLQAYMDQRAAKSAPVRSTNPLDLVDEDGIIGNGLIQDIRKSLRRVGGVGLYAGAASGRGIGMGLYAGGMCGEGIKSALHDGSKKFVNQARSIIGSGHPALSSNNLDANFLASNQLPPAYQRRI